jgi:VRR-NUC domain
MNVTEKRVAQFCRDGGFTVYRNGWPDFLLLHEGRAVGFALEVKTRSDRLRSEQKRMIEALDRMGIVTHTTYADEIDEFLANEPISTPALGRTPYRSLGMQCERVLRRLNELDKKCEGLTEWHNEVIETVRHELSDLRKTFTRLVGCLDSES